MAYHFGKIMQSWSAKSSEVAILESNVEVGLRERFFLNNFYLFTIQDLDK